ncbi:hypothetical protein HAX54_032757 [Datura stramonium]|uniref:Uncharacterized protein n=1 Tax=Datura stramonium TaxID=4076 RepID=A0ABS8VB97_DATST|nr:hypothetical protein [Datura stramonium]
MSDLIASQEKSTAEIERLTALLVQKEAEIVRLKAHPVEEPGAVSALREEMRHSLHLSPTPSDALVTNFEFEALSLRPLIVEALSLKPSIVEMLSLQCSNY